MTSLPSLTEALMASMDYTREEATQTIQEMVDLVQLEGYDYEEALEEYGLEPDYLPDLIAHCHGL